jgi:hypothetical protein
VGGVHCVWWLTTDCGCPECCTFRAGEKYTSLEVVLNMLAEKEKKKTTDLNPHRDIVTSLLCKQPMRSEGGSRFSGTRS